MNYQIQNQDITVTIASVGAELQSIQKQGAEYLWQGDEKYWNDHSPLLFPFVGRLTNDTYFLEGKTYSMGIHGFARMLEFDVIEKTETLIIFEANDTYETYQSYPYHFIIRVSYELIDNAIVVNYLVKNISESVMYFGIGGHPGFQVPLEEGLAFDDYYLEFSLPAEPDRIGHSPTCYLNGMNPKIVLEDGTKLRLSHDMFDDDAIVLQNMARQVCLKSDKGQRRVTVSYPQFSYLGLWHAPKTEAPYICIEPWTSLASRQDVVEEFCNKSDMVHLAADEEYGNEWKIVIE